MTVTKGWIDNNDADENRPESVEVQLTADGETVGDTVTLSADNNWTNTWSELPLNDDGEAIAYSVVEVDVPVGYTSSVNDEDHGNLVITNSYTPEGPEEPEEPSEPGEPEEPEAPEEPSEPGEPEEPSEPGEPGEPSDPFEPEAPAEGEDPEDALPSTGTALSNTIAMVAGILLALGAGLFIFTRRRNTVK